MANNPATKPTCRMKSSDRPGLKELPKRNRYPPKKLMMCEPETDVEKLDGHFIFVAFQDGFTAKIFKTSDVLKENESPIASFRHLRPGEKVLAKWSDNKFYSAVVDFIGSPDQKHIPKKLAKNPTKSNEIAAQRFYAASSVYPTAQNSSPQWNPLAAEHSSPQAECQPFDFPAQHHPQFAQNLQQLSFMSSQHQLSFPPALHQPALLVPQPVFAQPKKLPESSNQNDKSVFIDLDNQQLKEIPNTPTPKESFLQNLFTPAVQEIQSHSQRSKQTKSSRSEDEDSSSGASSETVECDSVPDCGAPSLGGSGIESERPWEPCESCKPKIKALMQENRSAKDWIGSIGAEQLQAVKDFIEKVEALKAHKTGFQTKHGPRQQELYENSGLFISPTKLAAIYQESKKDCLRLFHLLFDELFTPQECINAVAFGKHGKVPEGKNVLDRTKVNGLLTYVMSCGKLDGWKPVEKAKVKKALINKCRMRAHLKNV